MKSLKSFPIRCLSTFVPECMVEYVNVAQLTQHSKTKYRQTIKFNRLRNRASHADLDNNWRRNTTANNVNNSKWVRNMFDRELTFDEISVLSKGLNFAVTEERPPIVKLITSTESAIVHANLDESKAEELRHRVYSILVNSKPPPQNISRSERKALNDLSRDKNIVILPADNGKCTVVLNSTDCESKCDELLKDRSVYKLLGHNPTKGYRKKICDFVNNLVEEDVIDSRFKHQLLPPSEPTVPGFYGLPKIHKPPPIPVRPIVSNIGSVTYNIAKYVAKILNPLVGKSPHHLVNSQDFVSKIKDIK